ncbi:OmpA family protein [Clostridium faecium]|uniref:OmpA family protein n=1 Tax=Clostridium faecium TaxID=2762223 RepID=A0ABR8YQB6_9CLOT|nr:flagellar motor protein MotB [Clostridium faecium]MBD8046441.1 OmpA family protein [Clostridium faecium]
MSKKKSEIRTDAWMNTFADTMTLLLTFFVLLYSFSTVDAEKFQQISTAFQSMFSGKAGVSMLDFNMSSGEVPVVGKPENTTDSLNIDNEDIQDNLYEQVSKLISESNLQDDVKVFENEKGINIQLKETVLFESGKSELLPNSRKILNEINTLVSKINNNIIIEGHTDNMPISTAKFPSNWYLSSARALSVLDYFLIEKKQPNPERFIANAYGEYNPIVPNDTDEHRAMNRRVNIIIVTEEKE